jgi:glycosyltransferase involved in cell wall biosynthesis
MIEINPVTGERRPADEASWRVWRSLERLTVKYCSRAVFTSAGALRIYAERYPHVPNSRWAIIPNGYDEEHFIAAERLAVDRSSQNSPVVLLHSGVLYGGTDRDPSQFFAALGKLRRDGKVSPLSLRVVLRASGYEKHYQVQIRKHGIEDIVFLEPAIPYREALAEMLTSDGLLIFQGYTSNPAIPAKLYEYFRARRPIFALVDSQGDTANTLKAAGVGTMVPMDSEDRIAKGLVEFLRLVREGKAPLLDPLTVKNYARESHARELAQLLHAVTDRQKHPERLATNASG